MISIGQKLQSIRTSKRITQAELVMRTGTPQSGLSNIERGKNDITVSTLIRICSALEINPAELFQGRVPGKRMAFTRDRIEKIAAASAGKALKLSEQERKVSECLKIVVPLNKARKSIKSIRRTWNDLRRQYSDTEITILTERAREASERLHAKKPH